MTAKGSIDSIGDDAAAVESWYTMQFYKLVGPYDMRLELDGWQLWRTCLDGRSHTATTNLIV